MAGKTLKLPDNKGNTLVEMIVSFVILGIFVAAAAAIMVNCINVYYRMTSANTGTQIAQIVLNKTEAELTKAAQEDVTVYIDFTHEMYGDYRIKTLTTMPATRVSSVYPANVVRVALTLSSDVYGEYSAVRYVKCTNLDKSPNVTFWIN